MGEYWANKAIFWLISLLVTAPSLQVVFCKLNTHSVMMLEGSSRFRSGDPKAKVLAGG